MKTILDWLKNLLSNSDEVSSKRVVTITSLLLIISLVVAHIFGKSISTEILWAMISLCAGSLSLTVTNDILKPK